MHIWDIGTVSHCTWMGLQCDTFLEAVKQHIFCGLDESFVPTVHNENSEIHKVFRSFRCFIWHKISRPVHQNLRSFPAQFRRKTNVYTENK